MADVYCPECSIVETSDGPRVRLCEQHAERDRLAAELAEARAHADAIDSRAGEVLRTGEETERELAEFREVVRPFLKARIAALEADLAAMRSLLKSPWRVQSEQLYRSLEDVGGYKAEIRSWVASDVDAALASSPGAAR